jgi:uncharacterized protein with PIN domain
MQHCRMNARQPRMTEAAEKRFVIDSMLGKLAKWLRILGFDARYERLGDQQQIDRYRTQGFFLLTRNRRWSGQTCVFCLTANDPLEQLREVVSLVSITPQETHLLERCVRCNDQLREIAHEEVFGHVPDYVFETHSSFHRCPNCLKIYWPGSHPKRMLQRLQRELGWASLGESPEP